MSGPGNGHPEDRLSEYLDDQLSVEERAAIDRHLASCEECRSTLDALRRLARAIAEEGVPPLPSGLHGKIGRRLDEATVVRPRRWRFAVPATIAATISAIGILVAVQWREGRLTPPAAQEAAPRPQAEDDRFADVVTPEAPPPESAPAPPLRDESAADKAKERADADSSGVREKLEPEAKRQAEQKDFRTVVGGVVGGALENRASRPEAPPPQPALDQAQSGRSLQKQRSVAEESLTAAKLAAALLCADRWSDSGVRGTWETPDPDATARELNAIARDAGGIWSWRGIDDGRPYLLIVPRSRYLEVFHALRARGVGGLGDPPVLATGDDCTALSIAIVRAR